MEPVNKRRLVVTKVVTLTPPELIARYLLYYGGICCLGFSVVEIINAVVNPEAFHSSLIGECMLVGILSINLGRKVVNGKKIRIKR